MPFTPSAPEGDVIALVLTQSNLQITNWISYRFHADFLTPADTFSFVVADEKIDDATQAAIVPGAAVKLSHNGKVQASGFIDKVSRGASRSGGVEWQIDGRDVLGPAIDSCADPTTVFPNSATLAQVLTSTLGPYGFSDPSQLAFDNQANRSVITGSTRGIPTSKKGKPLKSFLNHQLKPHDREGAFQFCARLMQRQALWMWPSADGRQLIVSTPEFDPSANPPLCKLIRSPGSQANNILTGYAAYDLTEQPTVIVADGGGGGGEFGHSCIRSMMLNPAVTLTAKDNAYINTIFTKFRDVHQLQPKHVFSDGPMSPPFPRTLYLHDDESKTQDELDKFVYREMAKLTRHSLCAHYTVEGHAQNDASGNPVTWNVDTIVDVHDDVGKVSELMWVLARTFNKSRTGGTTTDLELIRLYGLEF